MKSGKSYAYLLNPTPATQNPSSSGKPQAPRPPPQRENRETSKDISTLEMTRLLDDHAVKITEFLNKKFKEQERKINQLEGLLNATIAKITILLNHVLHQEVFPSYYCTHQEIQAAISNALSTHLQAIKKPQENGKQTKTQGINSGNSNKPNSGKGSQTQVPPNPSGHSNKKNPNYE